MQKLVDGFKDRKIAVWGDFILDEYILTQSARVSREAPVLIAEFESELFHLGGAGNVAANLRSFGAEPVPVGVVGNDRSGKILREILEEKGIDSGFLFEVEGFTTPRKSRILSGASHTRRQQVLRIDRLNRGKLPGTVAGTLVEKLQSALSGCEFLLISDYLNISAPGSLLDSLRARMPLPPIAVDSRNCLRDFHAIRVATPNEPELQRLFPDSSFEDFNDFVQGGKKLQRELDVQGVVMKRGHRGMVALDGDDDAREIGIFGSREIVDVTGAGDTVISLLTLSLAAGSDLVTAARIATVAAGISVMKAGASVVRPEELKASLSQGNLP